MIEASAGLLTVSVCTTVVLSTREVRAVEVRATPGSAAVLGARADRTAALNAIAGSTMVLSGLIGGASTPPP